MDTIARRSLAPWELSKRAMPSRRFRADGVQPRRCGTRSAAQRGEGCLEPVEVAFRTASSLDLLVCFRLFDGHAKQSPGGFIASSTQTSCRDPGKDRRSGEGAGSDRWRAALDNEGCSSPEAEKIQRGGKSQNISGHESPLGEEEGKEARDQARNRQCKRTDSARAIEGTNHPNPEESRKVRGDSEGLGSET